MYMSTPLQLKLTFMTENGHYLHYLKDPTHKKGG